MCASEHAALPPQAIWTFNKPCPNAAQGSILDYHGIPKHALYAARRANAPLVSFGDERVPLGGSQTESRRSWSSFPPNRSELLARIARR